MFPDNTLHFSTLCLLLSWIATKHEVKQTAQAGKQGGVYKKENKSFIEVVVKSKEKTQKGLQHVS